MEKVQHKNYTTKRMTDIAVYFSRCLVGYLPPRSVNLNDLPREVADIVAASTAAAADAAAADAHSEASAGGDDI